jgi:hypothetical protein
MNKFITSDVAPESEPRTYRFINLTRGEPVIVNGIVNVLPPTPTDVPRMFKGVVDEMELDGVPLMNRFILSLNPVTGEPPEMRKIGGFVPAMMNDSFGGAVLIVPKGSPPLVAGVFELSVITSPFVD